MFCIEHLQLWVLFAWGALSLALSMKNLEIETSPITAARVKANISRQHGFSKAIEFQQKR